MELPLPAHWDPHRIEDVRRVPYETRATEATAWADAHDIGPAREDERRVGLLLVDCQNTFCTPGFELFVPGAPDDNRRLCEFVYRNLGAITQIIPTLDTHRALQVFHAAWLVDAKGRHPAPYTVVSTYEVEAGIWRAARPRGAGEPGAVRPRRWRNAVATGSPSGRTTRCWAESAMRWSRPSRRRCSSTRSRGTRRPPSR